MERKSRCRPGSAAVANVWMKEFEMQQTKNDEPIIGDRGITLKEVKERTGLGKTKIYAMIKSGEFPAPGKFGRASRWSEIAVDRALSRRFN
jgi:prophage regulatory protein